MFKRILSSAVLAGLIFTMAMPAFAQIVSFDMPVRDVRFVSQFGDDDDSAGAPPPVIWVKYIGSEESGTLDLNANALEFFSGPLGTEIAPASGDGDDVNVGDVCGTARGALDVTDTECDTPAELVNVINDADNDWVAVLANVLGAETLATAAEYVDPADAQAKLPGGLSVFIDSTDVDTLTVVARPDVSVRSYPANTNNLSHGDIEFYLESAGPASYAQALKANPYSGLRFALTALQVEADTTTTWQVLIYGRTYLAGGRVSDRVLYSRTDLTVDASTENEYDWLGRSPIITAPGETIVVRIVDDALVTGRISFSGFFFRDR